MSKDDVIETEGVVVEAMPGATFKVKIAGGHRETVKLESFVVKILNIKKFRVSFLFGFVYGR